METVIKHELVEEQYKNVQEFVNGIKDTVVQFEDRWNGRTDKGEKYKNVIVRKRKDNEMMECKLTEPMIVNLLSDQGHGGNLNKKVKSGGVYFSKDVEKQMKSKKGKRKSIAHFVSSRIPI